MSKYLIKRINSVLFCLLLTTILLTSFSCLSQTFAETQEQLIYGDISGDGIIDSSDYTLLRRYLLGISEIMLSKNFNIIADLNKDKSIDSADYSILRGYLLGNIASLPYETAISASPTPASTLFTPNENDVQMSIIGDVYNAELEISITLPNSSYSVTNWGKIEFNETFDEDFTRANYSDIRVVKTNIPESQIIKTPKVEKKSYNINQTFPHISNFTLYINSNKVKKIYLLRDSQMLNPIIIPYEIELYTPKADDLKLNKTNTVTGTNIEVSITLPDNSYGVIFSNIMQIMPNPDSQNYLRFQEGFLGDSLVYKAIIPESEIIKGPKTEKFVYELNCFNASTNYFSFSINGNILKELYFQGGLTPRNEPTPSSKRLEKQDAE